MTLPAKSLIGEIVTDTSISRPSLRTRTVSKCSTRSPRRNRARITGSSLTRSGGIRRTIDWPIISSAVYPKIRCAPLFQLVTTPLRSLLTTASSEESTIAARSRSGGRFAGRAGLLSGGWAMSGRTESTRTWGLAAPLPSGGGTSEAREERFRIPCACIIVDHFVADHSTNRSAIACCRAVVIAGTAVRTPRPCTHCKL